MSEIERINRYINRTKMNVSRHRITMDTLLALAHITEEKPVDAVALAFMYGQAKGYRAAKAEVRN